MKVCKATLQSETTHRQPTSLGKYLTRKQNYKNIYCVSCEHSSLLDLYVLCILWTIHASYNIRLFFVRWHSVFFPIETKMSGFSFSCTYYFFAYGQTNVTIFRYSVSQTRQTQWNIEKGANHLREAWSFIWCNVERKELACTMLFCIFFQ